MLKNKGIENLPEKWDYVSFSKGAQLRVKRNLYYHHGIFVGDGVVHFGEGNPEKNINSPEENRIMLTSLEDFLKGGVPEVRVYSRKEKKFLLEADEIAERAKSRLGEGGYNLYTNNCEHFSNYCAFGVAYCKSTDK
ncbi:MAG: hypothetical protein E7532_00185 [Ruminococcaceae bacterium]|nr:hypothetical protein [Oscillospiraceae bacterium]